MMNLIQRAEGDPLRREGRRGARNRPEPTGGIPRKSRPNVRSRKNRTSPITDKRPTNGVCFMVFQFKAQRMVGQGVFTVAHGSIVFAPETFHGNMAATF